MNLATFFVSWSWRILKKLLAVSESSVKIKVRLPWTFFVIFLTSAVICKQRILHGNEIAQYLQNYNVITLAQIILKSPYTVLQESQKETIFKQPVQFSKAIQF